MDPKPLERDEAWRRLFERLPLDAALSRDRIVHVTAEDMKVHGGREPRLMAKVDTLAERPAALAERGLAIFPVRNGRYVLFPDPGETSFYRFAPDAHLGPVRTHASAVDFAAFDTLPRGREGSESQALDFAHLSGLLGAFCGDEGLRLTLRGRFFSGDFAFSTPSPDGSAGGTKVDVGRVQIEVDAGYENGSIVLVEAKRGRRDDFHIRQLWYPWLHWRAISRKPVRPVFFAYSNGHYFLTEFAFGEGFGELEPVRSRTYLLDESPAAELDLRGLLDVTPLPDPAPGAAGGEAVFPQANELDKVVDLVLMAAQEPRGKEAIAEAFGFEERQADYYGNAGCFLGLLRRGEAGFEATAEGTAFAALRGRNARTEALVRAMLRVPALRDALALLAGRDYRAEKIAQGELAGIIRARTGLSGTTPERRASTLRAWLVWVMGNTRIRL